VGFLGVSSSPAFSWLWSPAFSWWHIAPAKGFRPVPAIGWRAAYPKQPNLLGSILAKTWWRTQTLPSHGPPPCFSQNRPQQVGLFRVSRSPAYGWHWSKAFGWCYMPPAKGWRPVPAEGWQAAYPKEPHLLGSILAKTL